MTRFRTCVVLVILGALGVVPSAETPATVPRAAGRGELAGRVVDARTNAPVADAVVTLNGHGAPDRVLVDAQGRFSFADLPAGTFGLTASHAGFSGGGFSQRQPWDVPGAVTLADDEHRADVTLKLWRLGALAGRVTNDIGDPLANVQVLSWRRTLAGGRWQMMPGPSVTTDDRGQYRLAGLDAGAYAIAARPDLDVETPLLLALLSANPASAADVMAAVTSGRGAPDVDASVEHDAPAFYGPAAGLSTLTLVEAGGDRERADVNLRLTRARTVRVSGRVTGRAEVMEAVEGLVVRLLPADASRRGALIQFEVAAAACDDTGHFDFAAVPPGRYVLTALRVAAPAPGTPAGSSLPAAPTLWGSAPLDVSAGGRADIALKVETGRIVSGQISPTSGAASPLPAGVSTIAVRLDSVDAPLAGAPANWAGHVGADGRFATADVPPGRYWLRVTNVPRGWSLERAVTAGRDVLDEPLTIADADVPDVIVSLTDRPAGSVGGHTDPSAMVLVFPVEPARRLDATPQARRLRRVRPATTGAFTVGGLPAGDYFAVAIASDLPKDWPSPVQLERFAARATRVHVGEGAAAPIELGVIK